MKISITNRDNNHYDDDRDSTARLACGGDLIVYTTISIYIKSPYIYIYMFTYVEHHKSCRLS